jgi:hypothetical protein
MNKMLSNQLQIRKSTAYKLILINVLLVINIININAEQGTIDTVYYYKQGTAEAEFMNNPNFPDNIFGIPSRKASKTIPASSTQEIEAIGIGGEIIVGFKDRVITNGPGTDFIIFENAFINPVNNGIFAESGIVSVSQDGITFFEFPYNPVTLVGLAGITPTNGDKDPFNPDVSGGDKFDLEDLGLDYIKYIKIKDTTLIIKSLPQSSKYKSPDFLLTGFDLDAIVGLYLDDESTVSVAESEPVISFKIIDNILEIQSLDNESIDIKIINLLGELVIAITTENSNINLNPLPKGIYFIDAIIGRKRGSYKFVR